MTQIKWVASLSNGETLYEGKGDYKKVSGELSPWQKLKQHLDNENLRITSLALYSDDGRRFNLPSTGTNPKFRAFSQAEKPESYRFFRQVGVDVKNGQKENEEHFAVIQAEYADGKKLQVWVRDHKPHESWVLIV